MRFDKENLIKKGKIIGIAVLILVVISAFSTGMWYQIEEQEEAVVVTFGEAKAVTEKGLHFKLPLIQQVRKVNTTIQGFSIGYTNH